MPEPYLPEHDTVSIVFVGSFNPAIFQPAWFSAQELITGSESTEANIHAINNDVCVFETSWFRLEVLNDRWSLTSLAAPVIDVLRDLAVGTFERLPYERVSRIGLNAHAHFAMPTNDLYMKVGHSLAPKDIFWDPVLEDAGLISLTVQGARPDEYPGHVRVRVEPSTRIRDGVFIEINDEYQDERGDSSGWAVKALQGEWENHRSRVSSIRNHFLDRARELK
jgi:hypothetical protein